MISIVRSFGAPVIEPPGKHARTHSTGVRPRFEHAGDGRDQLVHGRVGLDHHQLGHAHRVDLADAAEVVAQQVDDHQVLGAGLFVVGSSARQRGVLGRVRRRAALVPLIGRAWTRRSRSTERKRSGEELTISMSPSCRKAANGAGLRAAQQAVEGERLGARVGRDLVGEADLVGLARRPARPGSVRCRRGTARGRGRSGSSPWRSGSAGGSTRALGRRVAVAAAAAPRSAIRASSRTIASASSSQRSASRRRPSRQSANTWVRWRAWSTATTRLASISTASGRSERCTLGAPQSALHS